MAKKEKFRPISLMLVRLTRSTKRMKQVARLERYHKELSKITKAQNLPPGVTALGTLLTNWKSQRRSYSS